MDNRTPRVNWNLLNKYSWDLQTSYLSLEYEWCDNDNTHMHLALILTPSERLRSSNFPSSLSLFLAGDPDPGDWHSYQVFWMGLLMQNKPNLMVVRYLIIHSTNTFMCECSAENEWNANMSYGSTATPKTPPVHKSQIRNECSSLAILSTNSPCLSVGSATCSQHMNTLIFMLHPLASDFFVPAQPLVMERLKRPIVILVLGLGGQ